MALLISGKVLCRYRYALDDNSVERLEIRNRRLALGILLLLVEVNYDVY
jgi:hypothetical protein